MSSDPTENENPGPDTDADAGSSPITAREGPGPRPSPSGPWPPHPASSASAPAGPGTATTAERIASYEIVRELGRGGQGAVYLARDLRLRRNVALKVLTSVGPIPPALLERFLREATIASRLDHPGICGVLDAGEADGIPFIAMRYVEGETLARRIAAAARGGDDSLYLSFPGDATTFPGASLDSAATLPERPVSSRPPATTRDSLAATLSLVEDVARALHAAHELGVVHRDIKPGNIMVTPAGRPVVLDFGLARADDPEFQTITRSGDVFGTPAYMSPEQLEAGTGTIDRRTDVYSLGVTLFEALVHRRPFEAPTRQALYEAIRTVEPPDIREFDARFPRDLAIVVATALEKDRDRRYRTAEAFADDLRRVREREPITARPIGPFERLRRFARRNPAIVTAVLGLFAVLASGLVLTSLSATRQARLNNDLRDARGRADANLLAYERLADSRRVDDLVRRAEEELWPATPERLPLFEAWITEAHAVLDRLAVHRSDLEGLRRDAAPYSEEDRRKDEPAEVAALRQELHDLGATLERSRRAALPERRRDRLTEEIAERRAEIEVEIASRLGSSSSPRSWRFPHDANLQWRHDQLTLLVRKLEALAEADVFKPTLASVEARRESARGLAERTLVRPEAAWAELATAVHASPRYSGLELRPRLGLVPLGMNAEGYAEVLVDGTGTAPVRDATSGRYVVTAETGIVLVLLPGGRFSMGSDPGEAGRGNDETPHAVVLEPFFVGKYEVTQGQWARVMGRNPSFDAPDSPHPYLLRIPALTLAHPVENLSWHDADVFARRLGLELPTEAQWEFACRAGTTSAFAFGDVGEHPWTNLFDRSARSLLDVPPEYPMAPWDDHYPLHAPVDAFAQNGFGLVELHGNVSEWCRDGFGPYPPAREWPGDGLRHGADTARRTYRGGSYIVPPAMARSAARFDLAPAVHNRNLGCRVARRFHE